MMELVPLLIDEDSRKEIYQNDFCREIFKAYPDYYHRTGYDPPWIGYFVMLDGLVVGVGGFVGKPKDGRVEVAYGTSPAFEGQGVATFACMALVAIARNQDPDLIITAKTAPEHNASARILTKNGFAYARNVQDDGIGDAWEWILVQPLGNP